MTDNPVEIERKFLVAELPSLDGVDSKKIRQGYITVPSDSVQVRLRQKGKKFFITVKGKGTALKLELAQMDMATVDFGVTLGIFANSNNNKSKNTDT